MLLTQQVLNGIVLGAGYALVAVGITLVLRVLDIVNFAHGDLYMLGGLGLFFGTTQLGLPYVLAGALSIVAVSIVALIQLRLVRSVMRAEPFNVILATFALSVVISNLTNVYLDGSAASVDAPVSGFIRVGGVGLSAQRLLVLVVTALLFTGLVLALGHTRMGRQVRAVAQNPLGALVSGIRVESIRARVFVGAGAVAALGGVLLTPIVQVSPTAGLGVMLKGFVVIILGGLGSVPGAVVGGLALGVIEAIGGSYLGSEWTNGFGFVLLIAVLLLRPQGLLGTRAAR
jgi:branched-chain amino acid transport system permease protein